MILLHSLLIALVLILNKVGLISKIAGLIVILSSFLFIAKKIGGNEMIDEQYHAIETGDSKYIIEVWLVEEPIKEDDIIRITNTNFEEIQKTYNDLKEVGEVAHLYKEISFIQVLGETTKEPGFKKKEVVNELEQ